MRIRADQVGRALQQDADRVQACRERATMRAALRLRTLMVRRSDEAGAVDRGAFKNGWKTAKRDDGASVYNDSPYAGIIELGARPHKVSKEGIDAIAFWVERHIGAAQGPVTSAGKRPRGPNRRSVEFAEAVMAIAYAIARKIGQVGQKPRYIARDALPDAHRFYVDEFVSLMNARGGRAEP